MTTPRGSGEGPTTAPLLECDIVMSGGITSGIVYPGAVTMIARRYRFRSIGGTSVGAIAAAITAAAEYRRQSSCESDAFKQIAQIPRSLGEAAADGRSRLFHLFTPEPATRPLMALVRPFLEPGFWPQRALGFVRASFADRTIFGAVILALLVGLLLVDPLVGQGQLGLASLAVVMTLALGLVTWLAVTVWVLHKSWLPAWQANNYGLCTGLATPEVPPGKASFDGLTPWIHAQVQAAAGREVEGLPLTFGDLWTADGPAGPPDTADPAAPRAIDLAMIVSDLSRQRTAQLPFLEAPSPLYVEIKELERYVPPSLVTWMVEHAGTAEADVHCEQGVIRLPPPQHLPVTFAARLSAGFPILLSAVPLLAADRGGERDNGGLWPLRRVWFADGGLTSNLPLHFFDAPLPSRPTFCLNLVHREKADASDVAQQRCAAQASRQSRADVVAAPPPGDEVWGLVDMPGTEGEMPAPFDGLGGEPAGLQDFAAALMSTARRWYDNQLRIAPGVRDRVVDVGLRECEGGMKLGMCQTTIHDLHQRGLAAGELIAARFDPAAKQDPKTGKANTPIFANHRWVRYRNFMAAFEDLSRRFVRSRQASDEAAKARGETLLDDMIQGQAKEQLDCPAPEAARGYYRRHTDALEGLAIDMATDTKDDAGASFDPCPTAGNPSPPGAAPRPRMRLRLRPQVDRDPRGAAADLPEAVAVPPRGEA